MDQSREGWATRGQLPSGCVETECQVLQAEAQDSSCPLHAPGQGAVAQTLPAGSPGGKVPSPDLSPSHYTWNGKSGPACVCV